MKEKDSANFEKFKQDENHVDLMIKAEIHELGGWLKNCQSDSYKIGKNIDKVLYLDKCIALSTWAK